jgi:hypothetical protein
MTIQRRCNLCAMNRRLIVLLLAVTFTSCGGASSTRDVEEPVPAPAPPAAVEEDEPEAEDGSPISRSPGYGFAETSMTPMATAMADVVFAAVRGEALRADGPIPFVPSDEPPPCEEPGEEPSVIAFCEDPDSFHVHSVQIDFGFHVRAPDESAPNVIFTNVIVDDERLSIGMAVAASESRPRFETLPPWFATAARDTARYLRARLAREVDPGSIFASLDAFPPSVAAELREARSEGTRIAEAFELARLDTEIRAYTRDDLYVYLKNDEDAWVAARVFYAGSDETGLATRVRLRAP